MVSAETLGNFAKPGGIVKPPTKSNAVKSVSALCDLFGFVAFVVRYGKARALLDLGPD